MECAVSNIQSDPGASSGREPDIDRIAPSPAGRGLQPDRTVWHVDYCISGIPESPWIYDACDMADYEFPDEDICRDAGVLSRKRGQIYFSLMSFPQKWESSVVHWSGFLLPQE